MMMLRFVLALVLAAVSFPADAAQYRLGPPACSCVFNTANGATIPLTGAATNPDYITYQAWLAAGNTADPYIAPAPSFSSLRNWVINPSGTVDQAAGSYVNLANAAYGCDQWYALRQTSNTGNGMVCRLNVGTGANALTSALSTLQGNATPQRLGIAQVLEYNDTYVLLNKQVSYRVNFQPGAAFNMRLAILAWTGTADAPVLDQVNDWTSVIYTTSNFFKATTLTVICVSPSITGATDTPTFGSCTGSVPTSATNIIIMVWSEGTMGTGKNFYSWGHQLSVGGAGVNTVPRNYTEELILAQRFYEVARTAVYSPTDAAASGLGNSYSFKVQKRTTPTVTLTTGAAVNTYQDWVSYSNATTSSTIITINARL